MTQINELEQRIKAALDRIARGVENLDAGGHVDTAPPAETNADELAALREALEDERLANAQLEERVKAIREKQEGEMVNLRNQLSGQTDTLAKLDTELQRLRRANDMLASTNREMRAALEENVGEPHLINKAMLAELEGLRATRAADAAENRVVLEKLEPLLAAAAARQPEPTEEGV